MPNKKLKDKLESKASQIRTLQGKNKILSAKSLGALAFGTLNISTTGNRTNIEKPGLPSYGKTINPFPEFEGRMRNQSHSEFRRGFNEARKPKPVVITTNPEVNS